MRPRFDRDYIESEFQRLAGGFAEPLSVYLIGGGAMALRDLKGATKDIDLVVAGGEAYGQLWDGLMEVGYAEVQSLGPEYRELGATSCVENDDGCRIDIFNQQVANKLILTNGMRDRSEPYFETEQLDIQLVSVEDIFLFKMIAGREEDVEDLNMLVQAGLEYVVIEAELEAQIDVLGEDQFTTYAYEALTELNDRYGVTTPIEERLEALSNRYYDGLEVLHALDGPMTIAELAAVIDAAHEEIQQRVSYLVDFERVRRDGDTVIPLEDRSEFD